METADHQAQKAIFGIRVPNSGPLASPASIVNPVPRTYVRDFGALPLQGVQNIHPRAHARGVLWYGVKVAREAESQGFHSVWVHDHLTWTSEIHRTHISAGSEEALKANQKPDFYEAMMTLSYLAGILNSVRLGIACLVVPTRNPLYAAKQVANLDVLSGGRLDFGVGIGGPSTIISREYEVLGV